MEPSDRRKAAIEALSGCRIRRPSRKLTRPVSSFILTKPEVNRSTYNQCEKKHRYKTQADATRHMHIIQVIRPEKELRVYGPCPYCNGGWHITSKPSRDRRNRKPPCGIIRA